MDNTKNKKERFLPLLLILLIFSISVNSQELKICELEDFYGIYKGQNPLIILSESKSNPFNFNEGQCRKLCSNITVGSKGKWLNYYFDNCNLDGLWYKGFSFFKLQKPTNLFDKNKYALYDVANNCYMGYSNIVDNKCYLFMRTNYNNADKYEYFTISSKVENVDFRCLNMKVSDKKNVQWCCIKQTPDGKNGIEFIEKPKNQQYTAMYAFVNADFISDAIPDSDINPSANYLFLQRDYKLGGCYNSVIFPVDVPLQNEHHIYNGGKNRLVVYKLESVDDNCLNFVKDPSGVLLANTPYIVMSDGTDNSTTSDILSEFYMTDAPVDSFDINCIKNITPGEVTEVYAQYKKAVVQKNDCIDPDTDIFILSNNKLINCRNIKTTTVKRFRWYIKRPRGAAPLMLSLDGTVTAVANAVSLDVVDGRVYDLWGRCCGYAAGSGLPKGLFVNGGRVVAGGPVH